MPTRNGKIANLPNTIREQLNLRLLEGEIGRELASWLNAQPEVQSVLGSQFNGAAISEVNLTHWRQGGYLQWLTERECFDTAREFSETDGELAATGFCAERLFSIITVRLGQVLRSWDVPTDSSITEAAAFAETAKKARILQGITRSVLAIHRIQSQSALRKSDAAITSASSHAGHEQDLKSHPSIGPRLAQEKANGESRYDAMPPSSARGKLPNEGRAPRNGTILSPASGNGFPKILSGPITPTNLSQTPFNPDHILDEILKAI